MNQRFEELITQARGYWEHGDFNMPKTVYFNEFDVEKFAELIVRECLSIVDSMADPEDSERYFWAIQNASQKIKEHFGVD